MQKGIETLSVLTLTLLVTRILTNHPNHPVAADNLTISANLLY